MGAAAAPWMVNLFYGAMVVGTAYGIQQQRKATGLQEVEMELAKRQETSAAADREVQRKRRITAILGSQSAMAAAGGLAMTGSVANISIKDARLAGEESMIDRHTAALRIDALGRRQRSIGALGRAGTATSIMGLGSTLAQGVGGRGGGDEGP